MQAQRRQQCNYCFLTPVFGNGAKKMRKNKMGSKGKKKKNSVTRQSYCTLSDLPLSQVSEEKD
jgi:hypothetical protein